MSDSSNPRDEGILRLAEAVSDATPVDWGTATQGLVELAGPLAGLRRIQELQAVHRAFRGDASGEADGRKMALFQWGSLRVLERLGEGSFGEVFRAEDPALRRDVALKLRRPDAGGDRRFLDEARRLARVSHPNIVAIHGADVQEGRAGLWTDLLHGQTLEERLLAHGRLGAPEAALIGLDLCRALSAVHAAGLVHGDVKAANVMREDGGRIVLMDFGSVSEMGSRAGASMGTPLSLAPELLQGGAPTPASDVYALGVLLFRLVTGRYPVDASGARELLSAHEAGARVSLRELRPDLPTGFVQVVERAMQASPTERFQGAAEMERALAASVGEVRAEPSSRRSPFPAALIWAAAAAVVIALIRFGPSWISPHPQGAVPVGGASSSSQSSRSSGMLSAGSAAASGEQPGANAKDSPPAPPAVMEASLMRGGDGPAAVLGPGARIHPGDHLYLRLRLREARHIYILNEDKQGELFVLFPVAGSSLQNPIPGSRDVRLPGDSGGHSMDWQVTSAGGQETFLVVASSRPLPELESRIAAMSRAEEGRPVNYATLDAVDLEAFRGVGGLADAEAPAHVSPGSRLASLARAARSADSASVALRSFVLSNPSP